MKLDPQQNPVLDFPSLRQEGVALIQRLAGTTWTDYNAHDPGVTILEQFCYALTDLSYRINYDVEDLLGSGSDGEGAADNCLFSPGEVLTGNAVTMIDFRKVVIDVEGVKNAWIEPVETPAPTAIFRFGRSGSLPSIGAELQQGRPGSLNPEGYLPAWSL